MGMAKNTRERGREQAGMSREGRRTMEKVLENTVRDSNTQEEAAHRQQLLEANRAERAKRAKCKVNKANGVDRPPQSDDEE